MATLIESLFDRHHNTRYIVDTISNYSFSNIIHTNITGKKNKQTNTSSSEVRQKNEKVVKRMVSILITILNE